MGLPNVVISFKEQGITAIKRGNRGIVALVVKDATANDTDQVKHHEVYTIADAPPGLTEQNKKYLNQVLMGYINPPKKVLLVLTENGATDYVKTMAYLEKLKWNYVAFPDMADFGGGAHEETLANWVKGLYDTKNIRVKAVLANHAAGNHESIINFTTENIRANGEPFTTKQYCGRIAGLIAGTPMTISCTYAPLLEVEDFTKLTKDDADAAVKAGKLILIHDGEKAKIGRGVNSFTSTGQGKLDSFKKIKIVEAMDMIYDDIKKTAEDSYLGKYANSYDNKCLLVTAIQGYFDQLVLDGILDNSYDNRVYIDVDAQRAYLKSIGTPGIDDMNELEVKKANTKDQVFLAANIKILDAIEDITLNITI